MPRGELRQRARSLPAPRPQHAHRHAAAAQTAAARFPTWSASTCGRPKLKTAVMPGHWEGDFIKGAGNKSSVGVLVERTSRLVLLAKMEDATAASALAGFSAKLNSISRAVAPELHL